ncbi:MAG TPA: 4-oxalocrotonate decarboxylase [Desulfobacteraceae bacterium]|nr:4-oxalocrotonate decarboxylase [Desulfobacteraceae bacterium]
MFKRLVFALLIIAGTGFPCAGGLSGPADTLIHAEMAGQPIPLVSAGRLEMETPLAYEIQNAYIRWRLKTDRLAGYKAGLTSTGAQKRFNVDHPLVGALFASGQLLSGATMPLSAFIRPMIETEIGFILKKTPEGEIDTIESLKPYVDKVLPVIELPDLGFADMKAIKSADIIAANVSSRRFITGKAVPPDTLELDAVSVKLTMDGSIVGQGKGNDAMGGQWKAALWMVNTLIRQGRPPRAGHLLITGALGRMIPGKPGAYRADYGGLGIVEFQLD